MRELLDAALGECWDFIESNHVVSLTVLSVEDGGGIVEVGGGKIAEIVDLIADIVLNEVDEVVGGAVEVGEGDFGVLAVGQHDDSCGFAVEEGLDQGLLLIGGEGV